jgi:hypothetical protein
MHSIAEARLATARRQWRRAIQTGCTSAQGYLRAAVSRLEAQLGEPSQYWMEYNLGLAAAEMEDAASCMAAHRALQRG